MAKITKSKNALEKFKKIFKIIGKVILFMLLAIICFVFVLFVVNKIAMSNESKNIQIIGNRVEVYDNEYMNVYVTGSGKHTIVLLSGFGTSDPVIDFKKLADKLGENYRVAVVESFGYGFSDRTDKARTNENIVNETRIALDKAGINGPYVLMPHSMSGIYAMYYANKYPTEVEAVIGLDAANVSLLDYAKPEDYQMPGIYSLVSELGITRFFINAFPEMCGYSDSMSDVDEKYNDTTKYLLSKNLFNSTVINESNMDYSNELEIKNYKYSDSLPVLMILSQDSVDTSKNDKSWPAPKNWLELQENFITNSNIQTVEVLKGSHYIHWHNTDKISELVNTFVNKYFSN